MPTVEIICPVCGRPMTFVRAIRRVRRQFERAPMRVRVFNNRAHELDRSRGRRACPAAHRISTVKAPKEFSVADRQKLIAARQS
jgi:hypothetical protein